MESPTVTPDNKLTSDRLKAFQDALETFYIHKNISGRLKFAQEWPDAATYILGDQLLRFDQEGTRDKDLRERLEGEAEDRRYVLLEIVETIEDKSAERGTLKTEYVQQIVKGLGRGTALLLYSQKIVDRFLPESAGMAHPAAAPPPKKSVPVSADIIDIPDSLLPEEEKTKSRAPPSSSMDDLDLEEKPAAPAVPAAQPSELDEVQPISIEQILPQPVTPEPSEPAPAPPPEKKPGKGKLKIFGIKDGG